MSKSLRSYPQARRMFVAKRRINSGVKGCGYWAAQDYLAKTIFKGHLKPGQTLGQAEAELLERATS